MLSTPLRIDGRSPAPKVFGAIRTARLETNLCNELSGKACFHIFHGVPATQRSVFNLPTGPDHIVLYQKNIEAVCSSEAEIRNQIRQMLIHELGHYFGMTEEHLKNV